MENEEEFEKFAEAIDLIAEILGEMEMEVDTALIALSYLYVNTAKDQAEIPEEELIELITKAIKGAYSNTESEDGGLHKWLN